VPLPTGVISFSDMDGFSKLWGFAIPILPNTAHT
jgi:hypothetical protein